MLKIGGQRVPTRTLLLITTDAALILAGLVIATCIRFHHFAQIWNYLRNPLDLLRFGLVMLVCSVAFYYNDLYNPELITRRAEFAFQAVQSLGVSCLTLAIVYYAAPDSSLGRGIALLAAPTILVLLISWRLFMEITGFSLGGPERVLVLGTGDSAVALVREIIARTELQMRVVGFLDEKGENVGKSLVNPGIIGAVADVEELVKGQKVDRVILSLTERRGSTPVRQLLHLKFAGVQIEDAHSFNERISGRFLLEHLKPSWMILSDGFRKSRLLLASKRTGDVLASVLILLLTLPITALVAAAIWLETGSPVFFRQKRVGLGGAEFEIVKFRSMFQNAEAHGPEWAANDDERVTKVGRIIRKFRLDELPQIYNVFRGEMSLVGPRPERPYFSQILEDQISYYMLRHTVRPGITGWAQVKYQYGASVEESKTKLEYDLFYIKYLSFFLDLAILFETAKVIFYGRGAK